MSEEVGRLTDIVKQVEAEKHQMLIREKRLADLPSFRETLAADFMRVLLTLGACATPTEAADRAIECADVLLGKLRPKTKEAAE